MFILWAILLMAPQKEDGRPEACNLWPYNSDAETTFLSSPHLSSHYLADRVTLTISNRYSSHSAFFFFLPSPSAFCSLNPPPFQHPSRHALTKGYVHFRTFTVCSLSNVTGLMPSPHPKHPLCILLFEIAIEVGKQAWVLLLGRAVGLKNVHLLTLFTSLLGF